MTQRSYEPAHSRQAATDYNSRPMRPGPRTPLLLAALLGIAAAAWIALTVGGADPWPADLDPTTAEASSADATPAAGETAMAAHAAADTTATPDDEGDGALREDGALPPPGHGPRVRVVSGNPQVPVAGADVLYVTATAAKRQKVLPPRNEEWPELYGRRTETATDGTAELPTTDEPWLCCARHEGMFAFAVVPPWGRPVTLVLELDEQVEVAVADGDGRPVPRAPVALLQQVQKDGDAQIAWRGETAPNGRAVVRHFQLVRKNDGDRKVERFAAMLAIASAPPVLATFEGRPAQSGTIQLVMPPCGGALVYLTDHRGAPLLSPATLFAAATPAPDQPSPFPVPRFLALSRAEKPAGEEPVQLDWIARDATLRVFAQYPNARRGAASDGTAMPQGPGENAKIVLPPRPELAVVAGRAVVDGGPPLAAARITAVLWRGAEPAGQWQLETIADGRFDAVIAPPADPLLTLEVHVDHDDGHGPRHLGVRRDFRPPPAGQRLDFGDLVLVDLDTLCTGVVVDDRGEPVAGAAVTAQRAVAGQARETRNRRNLPAESNQAPPAPEWRDVPLLRATTAEDGSFALYGKMPPGELRVRADSPQHLADAMAWSTVGQHFQITIARNGVLRGRVFLPSWVPPGAVALTLQPFDEAMRANGTRRTDLGRRGGRFSIEPLHKGRYDAIVTLRGLPEPVLVLQDVFIEPGENRDARLRALDLRQSMFRFRLRAVDYAGRPLPISSPLLLRSRMPDGTLRDTGFRWQKGRAEIFTASPFVDLVSFAPGCEPRAMSVEAGDRDVEMRPLVPAQLVLPGLRRLCGAERRVRISVILEAETGFPQWLQGTDQRSGESFSFPRWELGKSNGGWLGDGDLVEVPIVIAGKYEVVVRVYATESERSPQASVSVGTFPLQIDGSLGPVTIPIDAQKIADAVQRVTPKQPR